MPDPIPVLIRTLAPVHLGCDEVYEPLGFVIHPEKQELVAFEPWSFLEKLPEMDRQEFARLCRKGTVDSLMEIYQFFYQRRGLAQGRAVAVCPGLLQHYQQDQQVLSLSPAEFRRQLTQFTIHRTAYLPQDQRPYIPGSAVKGALRTAYLNALAQQKSHVKSNPQEKGAAIKLEMELLGGSFDTDPFRLLKVSDFLPVGEVKTKVVYAIYEKKDKSLSKSLYQILEIIEPGGVFQGTLTLDTHREELVTFFADRFLTRSALWKGANDFFGKESKLEKNHYLKMGLKEFNLVLTEGACLLRLGRHSGADSVTIAGHRRIKISRPGEKPPRFGSSPTTLWFSSDSPPKNKNNLRPFGWVALEELSPAARQELEDRERVFRQQVEESRRAQPVADLGKPAPPATEEKAAPVKTPPATQVWEAARLTWKPGKQEVEAAWQGKKATGKGRDLIPEELRERLIDKRKAVTARVTVEPVGLAFRLVKIEAVANSC